MLCGKYQLFNYALFCSSSVKSGDDPLGVVFNKRTLALPEDVNGFGQLLLQNLQRSVRQGLAAINTGDGFIIDKTWDCDNCHKFLRGLLPELFDHLDGQYQEGKPTILTCTRTSGQSPKRIILTGSYLPDGAMIHQVTRGGKGGIASSILILSKCREPFALISYFFSHGCDL